MLNELQKKFGFSKSEIADKCGFSPSLISAVDDGSRSPRWGLEKLQQLYDSLIKPKPPDAEPATRDKLEQQLLELKERDPSAYESIKQTIEVFHDRISLTPDQIVAKAGRRAVEDVKKPGVTYGRRKRKSGGAKPSVAGAAEKLLRGSADIVRNSES